MRFWVGVTAAFGAGTLIGIAAGTLLVEDKLKKEYKEATAQHWRILQGIQIEAETPDLDDEVTHIRPVGDAVPLEGGMIEVDDLPVVDTATTVPPQTDNPYHTAVQHTSGATGLYASYAELSEEDYLDEDGREKEQITMTYSDGVPMFFIKGQEIEDAFERVGGTIVDDMRKAVGEGNPYVYIRNNQTDTDYEVMFEQP